jgi:hypothetical protein
MISLHTGTPPDITRLLSASQRRSSRSSTSSKSSAVTLAICLNVIGLSYNPILPKWDIVSDRMRELSFGLASDTTDAGY